MWNLSEASDTALKVVHENNLIELLLKHASLQTFGHRVVTSVMQCVFTISEDCKEPILSTLRKYDSIFTALKSSTDETPEDLHIRLLAYGIEMNLVEANGENVESLWSEMIQIISLVLGQDQRKLVRLTYLHTGCEKSIGPPYNAKYGLFFIISRKSYAKKNTLLSFR